MTTKYIGVGDDGEWGLIINYNLHSHDADELAAVMDSFGMSNADINEALGVLLKEYNSGMCVSREDLRMSAVFIGRTDSRSQFWNTISHELTHVGTAIIDYYAVSYSSEAAAYLQGYLLQRVVEEIAIPCK